MRNVLLDLSNVNDALLARLLTLTVAMAERLGHESLLRPLLVVKDAHARLLHSTDYPESAA